MRMSEESALARRQARFGWWTLLVSLTLGILIEALHAFKVPWLIDVQNETRRFMWRLAHAHGTLLGLLHIVFAVTLARVPEWPSRPRTVCAACLRGATILLPGGFFLGGLVVHDGDPGLGILLVPPGALLLLLAVFLAARASARWS